MLCSQVQLIFTFNDADCWQIVNSKKKNFDLSHVRKKERKKKSESSRELIFIEYIFFL